VIWIVTCALVAVLRLVWRVLVVEEGFEAVVSGDVDCGVV
jgi:hypothetical protein